VIKRWFSLDSADAKATALPERIVDQLKHKNLDALRDWLGDLLRNNPAAPEWEYVVQAARGYSWTAEEIGKLEIFGCYYRGDLAQAQQRALRYLQDGRYDPELLIVAAYSLYHMGRFENAYETLRMLREQDVAKLQHPDHVLMAALICQAANQLEEMKGFIDSACLQLPDDPGVAANAYGMYFELGETDAWMRLRDEFKQGCYPIQEISFAMGTIELALGNYAEGFKLLEMRYGLPQARNHINHALFDRPRWQGEPLAGRTLLVTAEQGLGDIIQMSRYLSWLERLGAKRVLMEVQPAALSLLEHNFSGVGFVEGRHGICPAVEFDCWTGSLSLAHLYGTTASNIPGKNKYLCSPPESTSYWSQRVKQLTRSNRKRVGLAWSGQPAHLADRRRSIPAGKVFEIIHRIDANFFALQTSVPAARPANLLDLSEELVTLLDTAALIAEMDLVITVDTSVVHLAGALGKETWLLLPYRYEWRWGLEGEGNHWYDSVKVLRQPRHDDWDSLLEEVFGRRLPLRAGKHKEE